MIVCESMNVEEKRFQYKIEIKTVDTSFCSSSKSMHLKNCKISRVSKSYGSKEQLMRGNIARVIKF